MSHKSTKTKNLNSASTLGLTAPTVKERLGLISLEPRILLDAAGFVTGAEVAMETMIFDDAQLGVQAIFDGNDVRTSESLEFAAQNEELLASLSETGIFPVTALRETPLLLEMDVADLWVAPSETQRLIDGGVSSSDIDNLTAAPREISWLMGSLGVESNLIVEGDIKANLPSEPIFMTGPPVVDLNGPDDAGINFETSIQPTTSNIFATVDFDATVMSSTGLLTSVTIDFAGILDGASELAYHNGPAGATAFFFDAGTQSATVAIDAGGTVLLDVTRVGTSFTITGAGGAPTADVNIQTFLSQFLYGDLAATATEGPRTMSITLSDTSGVSQTAVSTINVHYFPTAGNDVWSVRLIAPPPQLGSPMFLPTAHLHSMLMVHMTIKWTLRMRRF